MSRETARAKARRWVENNFGGNYCAACERGMDGEIENILLGVFGIIDEAIKAEKPLEFGDKASIDLVKRGF